MTVEGMEGGREGEKDGERARDSGRQAVRHVKIDLLYYPDAHSSQIWAG